MIHGSGPDDKNDSPEKKPGGDNAKPTDPKIEYEMVPLEGLHVPPNRGAGKHVAKLFTAATPEAIAELSDILWTAQSPSLLSYFGARLADSLAPQFADLACEVIRRKSFHCTQDLLTGLATTEYARFVLGHPPVLEGPSFIELRKLIADICVSPASHFVERDWRRYGDEIIALANFPITILRRSAGPEVHPILVNAATRGDLDQFNNRRALELLALREASDPGRRVLSGREMAEVSRATESLLRDPFNVLQLFALVDTWAAKEEELPSPGECAIRDQLVRRWVEFRDSGEVLGPEEIHRVFEVVRILRNFKDPVAGLALQEASRNPHTGLRLLAKLSIEGPKPEVLAELRAALRPEARSSDTFAALRVFGYHLSPEVDRELVTILNEYVQHAWAFPSVDSTTDPLQISQRVILLQGMVRRFYSERIDSVFLRPIFESIGTENNALNNVAINTFLQAVQIGRIPPPHFYDDLNLLSSLHRTLAILGSQAQSSKGATNESESNDKRDSAEERKDPEPSAKKSPLPEIVRGLQDLFVLQGPAAYGFELAMD